jgi:trehalose/maltose hydrolase-like predicted phosphorylase
MKVNPDWEYVANNIPILTMPDTKGEAVGVTREHASYQGEGIKQADVNLLAYPLKTITDKGQVKKDLDYYSKRVPNQGTPAMTQAIFALLYARLGETEKAHQFFNESYVPNLNPPFRVIAETKGGTNPYFATGAGGIVQSLLMGFGGLDITEKGMVQLPTKLPKAWKKLTISGVQGKTYTIQ